MTPSGFTETGPALAARNCLTRGYAAPLGVFDELCSPDGSLRPHWQRVASALGAVDAGELNRRRDLAEQLVRENGVTYSAWASLEDRARPWKLDILPVVFPTDEWDRLAAALAQRVRLLDLVIRDLYGPQELIRRSLLPPEAVYAHAGFLRPAHGMRPGDPSAWLQLYSAEVARSADGRWWVMADRTQAPVGCGYALENRIVISRTWPQVIQDCRVRRLAPFFMQWQEALQRLAPLHKDNPHVVLLSPGPADPHYFEDAFLARYLGYTLAEGGDLAVRDEKVWLKTLGGLLPVDVILRRVGEGGIDPLELGGNSPGGIPGLLQCVRQGHVAVANPVGCELVESPLFMAFLPRICRELLGEELLIPSIATWWCIGDAERRYVLDHLNELVVKPAFHAGGDEVSEIHPDRFSRQELARLRDEIQARPLAFVAQERVARSASPSWRGGQLEAGHVALRCYAVAAVDSWSVMPGGLVRLSSAPGPIGLSISTGDESADAWVLADGPVQHVTLLAQPDQEVHLRRTGAALPSRVADNLYWLGRQLERVDNGARLLRTIFDRLTVETRVDAVPELPALIRVLAARGMIEPGFVVEDMKRSLPAIETALLAAIDHADEPLSLGSTMAEALRLASVVRDRISVDTWRMVNRMDSRLRQSAGGPQAGSHAGPSDGPRDLGNALHRLDLLIFDVAACYGLATDSMTRGQAWRFLDIGRRIERGLQTISLLRETVARLSESDVPVLQAVLEVADSSMTYRARYMAQLRRAPVLDLLLTDESNPHALAYQLTALHDHVESLPREQAAASRSPEQKAILTALHQVRIADVAELCRPRPARSQGRRSLDGLLGKVETELRKLSDHLTRRYLVHAGPPRQMTERPGSM
jgi:uncharacterized circularly permuted ATP-grasp superfamily protein/uncharacterized alpha-E superfamily protein